ncbi:Scarecrow-like protein 1 [Nymphaea thermarum]|nr:Scarecrow-like protein 1 [Nymphaea thermarum]
MATFSYVSVPQKRKFIYSEPEPPHGGIYDGQFLRLPATGEVLVQPNFQNYNVPRANGSMLQSVRPTEYQSLDSSGSSDATQDSYGSLNAAVNRHFWSFSNSESSHILDTSFEDHSACEIRKKLEELERELLDDNVNKEIEDCQDICVDGEWAEPIKNLLPLNSPKESSSDSNLSGSKEMSNGPVTSPLGNLREMVRSPKELLFECALAISEGKLEEASTIINDLRQMVSIDGDPEQRITAYMVEGLAARLAGTGHGLYKALKCKEPPTSDRLAAMQILFEGCPCFKFGFMAANGAIAEALKDEKCVHIIDFDINQGSQYITLIQALSTRQTSNPTRVRITGVDDPESVQRAVGGLRNIGQRLEMLAEAAGVPFEFRAIHAKTCDVTRNMLDLRPGEEALIVNFAFQLHHMPDESVSTLNQRDRLLRMVKSLNPKLVTVVEQDVNTNTAPFLARFHEVYEYYLAIFQSLDVTMPRERPDRMNVERQCLARNIVNIVACEGEERIERYEVAGKWRARMMMAGFEACPLSTYVNDTIRTLLHRSYCDRYKLKDEGGALYFGWEGKNLVVASAWR